ncbi:hypothetical protein KCU90_g183, partial [Aureobasidium melanogenum]
MLFAVSATAIMTLVDCTRLLLKHTVCLDDNSRNRCHDIRSRFYRFNTADGVARRDFEISGGQFDEYNIAEGIGGSSIHSWSWVYFFARAKQRVDWALTMRQENVGLLAVASERRKTERAMDAILKLYFSKYRYVQGLRTIKTARSTRAFPDERLDKMEICFGATLSRRSSLLAGAYQLQQVAKRQKSRFPLTLNTHIMLYELIGVVCISLSSLSSTHICMRKLTTLLTESQKQPATSSSTPAA